MKRKTKSKESRKLLRRRSSETGGLIETNGDQIKTPAQGKEEKTIDWHSGFSGGIQLELRRYKDFLEFEREHVLSRRPLKIDMLIIKKHRKEVIDIDIARIFRTWNVVEYKGTGDALSQAELHKALAYAALLKSEEDRAGEIDVRELTVSLFRYTYPEKLFRELKEMGMTVTGAFPGVYYIEGLIYFPVQIVVMKELEKGRHTALKILAPDADPEEIESFLKESIEIKAKGTAGDHKNADAVIEVSSKANKEIFHRISREDREMFEVLKDIMREEIDAEVAAAKADGEKIGFSNGEKVGFSNGEKAGAQTILYDLVHDKVISLEEGASRAGMDETLFIENMNRLYSV